MKISRRRLALGLAALLGGAIAVACSSDENEWLDANEWVPMAQTVVRAADHCGWDDAEFLRVYPELDIYVRDPKDRVPGKAVPYEGEAELPADAAYTGIHKGNQQIWVSPSASESIFIVTEYKIFGEKRVERWPKKAASCLD